jgi:hypothetical protein
MKTALLFLFACTLSFSQITRSGGGRPKACVGSPGDTVGAIRDLCATSAGALYVCKQAGGCTLAAHWQALGGAATYALNGTAIGSRPTLNVVSGAGVSVSGSDNGVDTVTLTVNTVGADSYASIGQTNSVFHRQIVWPGATQIVTGIGDAPATTTTGGAVALTAATSTDPSYTSMSTGSTTNNQYVAYGRIAGVWANGTVFGGMIRLTSATNIRAKLCLGDSTVSPASFAASGDPAYGYVCLIADTAQSANWLCQMRPDSGGTRSSADSGVAIDTNQVRFSIANEGGSTGKMYINGAQVCGDLSTGLPTAGTPVGIIASIRTLEAADKALGYAGLAAVFQW